MTDSKDRKPKDNTKEAIQKRMEKYDIVPADKKEHVSELPRWVKNALVDKEFRGMTWREVAKKYKKSQGTVEKYAGSPAGKKWRELIRNAIDDPAEVVRVRRMAEAFDVHEAVWAMLEAATEAGDYAEAGKMLRDMMDRTPGMGKQQQASEKPPQIVVNVQGGGAAAPIVDADYEIMEVESETKALPPGEDE